MRIERLPLVLAALLMVAGSAQAAQAFETDADAASRKVIALAKQFRFSGRMVFLQGQGWRSMLAGDFRSSKAAFQKMIDEDPESDEGYLQLATVAESAGDAAEAARLYSEALARRPDLAAYYRKRRGAVLFDAGRWDLALQDAEAGLAASPRDPDLLRLRAKCLIYSGDFARAAASYNDALTHGRRKRTGEDDWLCGKLASQGLGAKGCGQSNGTEATQ